MSKFVKIITSAKLCAFIKLSAKHRLTSRMEFYRIAWDYPYLTDKRTFLQLLVWPLHSLPGYLCSVIEAPIYQFAATSYSIASKQSRLGNLTRDFCQDSNGSRDSSLIVEQLSPNGHISLKVPIVEFDFGYSFARYDKDSSFWFRRQCTYIKNLTSKWYLMLVLSVINGYDLLFS